MTPTRHRIHPLTLPQAGIPDGSVQLIVTSPPYPMIRMWDGQFGAADAETARALEEGDGVRAFDLMHRTLEPVWMECRRVLGDGGFLCVNIGDAVRTVGGNFRLYSNHSRVTEILAALGFETLPVILWRKTTNAPNKFMGSGMLPAGAYPTLEHEYILIFRKGDKRVFITAADRRRRRESAIFWEERNRWFSDLWELQGRRQEGETGGARKRSGAFPLELAYRLVCMFSLRGDLVLDPFLGTGTTLAAAAAAGRNGAGCEIDPVLAESVPGALLKEPPRMRAVVRSRLERHAAFVRDEEARGRSFGYRNGAHGLPVVSAQETDLVLEMVREVRRTGIWTLEAEYETLERAESS